MPHTARQHITFKTPGRIAQETVNALNCMGRIDRTQQRDPQLRSTVANAVTGISTADQHRDSQPGVTYIPPAKLAEHLLDSLTTEGHIDTDCTNDPELTEYLAAALTQTCTSATLKED